MVRQEDKAKIRNVKVISSEECVPKHKLLVMDMWFKATKTWRRKFEPRVRVWKLKEEKTCDEYRCMVVDKVEEANWKGLGVNDHWQQMKGIMMETAQDICPVVKVDRMITWHYTTTILRLRIGARLTRYRNCKFHNFARTISRHADGISRYSVPPSAGPLLPLRMWYDKRPTQTQGNMVVE